MSETIAAVNLAGITDKYSQPFIKNIFIPANDTKITECESCIMSDFVDRNIAENNNTMLQLVSYTIIADPRKKRIFTAQRVNGEKRLKNMFCIGFGGHVSIQDFLLGKNDPVNPILKCAKRELAEEVDIRNTNPELHHIGFARSLSSSTSNHLGSVYYVLTKAATVKEKNNFAHAKWINYDVFKEKYYYKLEDWSKAIFDFIYENDEYRKIFNF